MTDQPNSSKDRLEGMLRRWGAQEALRGASPAPALTEALQSQPAAPRRGTWRAVLRWAPMGAAAMLLLAAGAVYLAATSGSFAPLGRLIGGDGGGDSAAQRQISDLRKQAADWQRRAEAAEKRAAELADLPRKLQDLQAKQAADSAAQAEEVRKLVADAKARQAEAAALAQAKTDLEAKLADAAKDAKALAAAADEAAKARTDVAGLKARLTAAAAELQLVHKQQQQAETEAAVARQQTATIQARHAEVVAAFQRTYLASLAPGEQGLQARKTAVRVRHMIDRCAALSAASGDEATRALLARLEAVLTRLDLLNPDRPGTGEGFWKLVGRDELRRQIDQALSVGGQSQDVRNWLFEAKLILSGESNAG